MRLYMLVGVDVDRAAVREDNPPEDVRASLQSELAMHLQESGVRGALGIVDSDVQPVTFPEPELVQPLPWEVRADDANRTFPVSIFDANGMSVCSGLTRQEAEFIVMKVNGLEVDRA